MKSMTGFGKEFFINDKIELDVEIKSVNSRFLDLKIYLPRELSELEILVRKLISNKIKRGKVDVRINFTDNRINEPELNEEKLISIHNLYKRAQELLNNNSEIPIEKLLNEKDVVKYQKKDMESLTATIGEVVTNAVEKHQIFAKNEGDSMKEFVLQSIDKIYDAVKVIEEKFPLHKESMFEALKAKVTEIIKDNLSAEDHKRLLTETAVYAEKADVSEEIVRLKNHIEKFIKLTNHQAESGKSMNFILQEMHREINTIGSKFNTSEVISDILLVKEEIEKCREIVQNVE